MTSVDSYLDDLFERLAGTGPDGRRLLVEAEQHLADAVAEARGRGLDTEAAEREAVQRFGAATDIVRQLPVASGTLRISLRRLAAGTWALTGIGLAWYGLSGVLTWLLAGPWVRLLIWTHSFGFHAMCERGWIPSDVDCFTYRRGQLTVVPWGGADFPFLAVGLAGLVLVGSLVMLRRRTGMGAADWTPSRTTIGLALAVPFGVLGLLVLFYGAIGIVDGTQEYGLSYGVTGLSAVVICLLAVQSLRRRFSRSGRPGRR
ncbi:permease prefix domain 1-containing protein [Actinoplanes sp. NPDC051411]|uniref:permease prefix domain 1-containing protein n=1 Tax=Actinoplanes sp. NPDC051411 TaxID=3155522 RepID=UPI00341DF098